MTIEGSNLLSMFSGVEGLGKLQQNLVGGTGQEAGFATALMAQLGVFKNGMEGDVQTALPDLASLQNWVEQAETDGKMPQGLQHFAALLGKSLPPQAANKGLKTGQDIDLENTLQTLSDVLQQLQQLEQGGQMPVEAMAESDLTAEAELPEQSTSAQDATAASVNQAVIPLAVPQAAAADDSAAAEAEQLAVGANMLFDVKKPAASLPKGIPFNQLKNGEAVQTADGKAADPSAELERSLAAMLGNGNAESQSQQDKPNLDFAGGEAVVSQVADALDGGDGSAKPDFASDIGRMNIGLRSSNTVSVPSGQPSGQPTDLAKHYMDPAWRDELGQKLVWMHKQAVPSAELRLNPEHLGPISVKIDVNNDQATVAFTAQHLAVKEAIEAAIPKLREMLGGQQLTLVDVNVSQQQSDQRQAGREFFQASADRGFGRAQAETDELSEGHLNQAQDIVDEIEAGRAIASNGLLSLFA